MAWALLFAHTTPSTWTWSICEWHLQDWPAAVLQDLSVGQSVGVLLHGCIPHSLAMLLGQVEKSRRLARVCVTSRRAKDRKGQAGSLEILGGRQSMLRWPDLHRQRSRLLGLTEQV